MSICNGYSKKRHPTCCKPSGRGSNLIKTKSATPLKEWFVTNSYKMPLIGKLSSHPKFDKERRKQIFADLTMSNEGNHNRILLLLFLILVYCQTILAQSPSILRGGLVYSNSFRCHLEGSQKDTSGNRLRLGQQHL